MATLIYRCPVTGMNAQAWFADDASADSDEDTYVSTPCPACAQAHLVSPSTGRVVGGDEE